MVTFILGDFVNKFNLGLRRKTKQIRLPFSKVIVKFLMFFFNIGLIFSFNMEKGFLNVFFKYYYGKSIIKKLRLLSTPSRRIYWNLNKIKRYKNSKGFNLVIISTYEGLMLSVDCLRKRIGGEPLIEVIF